MAAETGVVLASSAERPIHLDAIYVNQAADLICRLPMATLLLSRTGPLRQDFAGCNSPWPAVAPRARHHAIDDRKSPPAIRSDSSRVKMFPIANDTAHRSIPRKGQQRVNVIGHEEKKCDVPAKFGVIEFRGLK